MRQFHVTYEVITHESAKHADAETRGYVRADGSRFCMDKLWGEEAGRAKQECALTLREALRQFGERYGRHGLEDTGSETIYQSDGTTDHRTGDETRLAFHMPETLSEASRARVLGILIGE